MFWKKKHARRTAINWEWLREMSQLELLVKKSKKRPVMIYKHSTRCVISRTALDRLEKEWHEESPAIKAYFLDLLTYRAISGAIAERFHIRHQSPQVILLKNGEPVYHASHQAISFEEIKRHL